MLVINPQRYMQSVTSGLKLFFISVFPSLFPFFFLSALLTELGSIRRISKALKYPMTKIFHAPEKTSYVFLMSILCGYPVGAKIIESLYESNQITTSEASKMLPLCSSSGPIFVIGAVGAGLLGNARLGAYIFLCHILSIIITAIIFRGKKLPQNNKSSTIIYDKKQNPLSFSIASSTTSILAVGAYVSIFYMFIDMAHDVGLINVMDKVISFIFDIIKTENSASGAISSGIIEMTRGCSELAQIGNPKMVFILCSALISFGGFSIIMQSLSFLITTKIKVCYFILLKCTQSIITIFVGLILSIFIF